MIKKSLVVMAAVVLLFSVLAVCPASAEGFPAGGWAFASDPAALVLQINEDGTAQYQGKGYGFEDESPYLLLTDAAGEALRLRYLVTEKNLWLYVPMNYTRKEGTTGEGIRGVWNLDGSEKGFFEFSEKGTFLEDALFDGTYSVDYEAGSFVLTYPRYLEETTCYFSIDEDRMVVEYPWLLVEWTPAEQTP